MFKSLKSFTVNSFIDVIKNSLRIILSKDTPFKMAVCSVALVVSDSLRLYGLQPTSFLCPWYSSCKNTGVGCHFLLQRILSTQGSEPALPGLQAYYLPTEPPGNPFIFYFLFSLSTSFLPFIRATSFQPNLKRMLLVFCLQYSL